MFFAIFLFHQIFVILPLRKGKQMLFKIHVFVKIIVRSITFKLLCLKLICCWSRHKLIWALVYNSTFSSSFRQLFSDWSHLIIMYFLLKRKITNIQIKTAISRNYQLNSADTSLNGLFFSSVLLENQKPTVNLHVHSKRWVYLFHNNNIKWPHNSMTYMY